MPKMNINEVKNIINSRLSDARDDKKTGWTGLRPWLKHMLTGLY